DSRWMTRHTDQDASGKKSFYSATSSPSEVKLEMSVAQGAVPTWSITTGGNMRFGDGVAAAAASIDFYNDRLRFSGKGIEFSASAPIQVYGTLTLTGAIRSPGPPLSLLGTAGGAFLDQVQRVTAADLSAFVGQPTLAAGAIGYGDGSNKLTGLVGSLKWDSSLLRLGILNTSPQATLDMVGSFKLTNTTTSASFPGGLLSVTDTSTSSAEWTPRHLTGLQVTTSKTGSATYVTSATLTGILGWGTFTAGSASNLITMRSVMQVGAAAAGPTLVSAFGFYSGFVASAGTAGTISTLVHYFCTDFPAGGIPQPVEVYGLQVPQLTSGTGATRTAGIRLDLSTTGVGQRFNLYAPGHAHSHFAGHVGIGTATPSARLECGVGGTTLAPMRLSASSTSSTILTTPIAGAFESRGDRLLFTDLGPVRHPLAFWDDYSFTNDPAAVPGGGAGFDETGHMTATLDPVNVIGTGDFTVWCRFRVPAVFRGPTLDGVWSIAASNALGSTYTNAARLDVNSSQLVFSLSLSGSHGLELRFSNFLTNYGGGMLEGGEGGKRTH